MKSFYVKTLGCKVNQADSERLKGELSLGGWNESDDVSGASVCVVNTCCVTASADRKSRAAVRALLSRHPGPKVLVTGCYARYDRGLGERFCGRVSVFKTVDDIARHLRIEGGVRPARRGGSRGHTRAFLKIQDGCDNRCSYCVVPVVRGPSRSRVFDDVLGEASHLVACGHREIVLSGVCLGAYGRDLPEGRRLADVIKALEGLEGLDRIRLSSVEPADVSSGLIDVMAASKKLCPHLHIPFQSGDDDVLASMNRSCSVKDYFSILEKARACVNDLSVTCDIIVGFPSETKEGFKNTVSFLRAIRPLRTHLFTFSPRRGAGLPERTAGVQQKEARRRYDTLKSVAEELSRQCMEQYIGKELEVLIESRKSGVWTGYARNYIRVGVESQNNLRNTLLTVKIAKSLDNSSLYGIILDNK